MNLREWKINSEKTLDSRKLENSHLKINLRPESLSVGTRVKRLLRQPTKTNNNSATQKTMCGNNTSVLQLQQANNRAKNRRRSNRPTPDEIAPERTYSAWLSSHCVELILPFSTEIHITVFFFSLALTARVLGRSTMDFRNF